MWGTWWQEPRRDATTTGLTVIFAGEGVQGKPRRAERSIAGWFRGGLRMRLGLVILAILHWRGPNTGYGIGRILNRESDFIWHAKLQQIYSELATLSRKGLVEANVEDRNGNGPNKKVYSFTPEGQQHLDEVLSSEPTYYVHRDDLILHMLCFDRLNAETLAARIEKRRANRAQRCSALRARLSGVTAAGEWLALSYELQRTSAETRWCELALDVLSKKNRVSRDELHMKLLA